MPNGKRPLFRRRDGNDNGHMYDTPVHEATWQSEEYDKNGKRVRQSVLIIVSLVLVLLVVLIASTVAGTLRSVTGNQTVTAQDSYAVSTKEQSDMEESCRRFATGLLTSTYCSDRSTATDARNIALSEMADGTASYQLVHDMNLAGGDLSSSDMRIEIDEPQMTQGTKAYASRYTYSFVGVVMRKDGDSYEYVDGGYDFSLTFSKAKDQDGKNDRWVISYAEISEHM